MKLLTFITMLGLSFNLINLSTVAVNAQTVTTQYQGSVEDFPNPERGFYLSDLSKADSKPLELSKLETLKQNNITLI